MESVNYNFAVNNCFGTFFKGTLDWIKYIYPRINYSIIGTYDKSVEFFNRKRELGRELDVRITPSVTLDPSYDFLPDDRVGKFLWQYPLIVPGLGSKLFNRIEGLDDQDISIVPVFTWYRGVFDLIFWVESVYEYMDLRTFLIHTWGGIDRVIEPGLLETFMVMPDSIYSYKDSEDIPIDWSGTTVEVKKINNINKDLPVIPIGIKPRFKLQDIVDSTTKYGGDGISEYKLSSAIEYEVALPSYVTFTPNAGITGTSVNIEFSLDATYSHYHDDQTIPDHRMVDGVMLRKDERKYYMFTQSDEDNYVEDELFRIENPIDASNYTSLTLVSYGGVLKEESTWNYVDTQTKEDIDINIVPVVNEIVEFFSYKK